MELMEQKVNVEKKDNQEMLDRKVNQDCQDVMEPRVIEEKLDHKEGMGQREKKVN